jgi:acetylornithine deacetylase/succinyl-diaminopimelate desuccinylase-like protein
MNDLTTRILDLAIAIQQIPAPTFHEQARAEFVRTRFIDEGLAGVKMDEAGNVYGLLAGSGHEEASVISAHLDTVFPPNVDLHFERQPGSRAKSGTPAPRAGTGTTARIVGPGIGDNSLGVAGLFGLVWALRERNLRLPGDLWLVANVCEEGLGDLRGMRAVVDHFEKTLSRAGTRITPLAYIVVEGLGLGQIYHRGLGVRRTRITMRTPGGHSWINYGQPSAIHELVALATHITALKLPRSPRTTLNIGIISGGSSVNTIAAEAMLELDLRSERLETLEAATSQVDQIVEAVKKRGVTVESEIIGERPFGELAAEHPLVRLAEDCLRAAGVEPHLSNGSTDANLPLSRGLPAIAIGLTSGGRAHSVDEYINVEPLEKGMEQLIRLVSKVWGARA